MNCQYFIEVFKKCITIANDAVKYSMNSRKKSVSSCFLTLEWMFMDTSNGLRNESLKVNALSIFSYFFPCANIFLSTSNGEKEVKFRERLIMKIKSYYNLFCLITVTQWLPVNGEEDYLNFNLSMTKQKSKAAPGQVFHLLYCQFKFLW